MKTKPKIHLLVDSINYIENEPYQHQLNKVLNQNYECIYHEIGDLTKQINKNEIILSLLKIRSTKKHIDWIVSLVGDTHIIVNDYDPWVSFEDGSIHKGTYEFISSKLNATFFVPSIEWTKIIKSKGLRCVSSKIGMLSDYCDTTPWEKRINQVEFRGAHYSCRDIAMKKLFDTGFPMCWKAGKIAPYHFFLERLSTIQVWAQSETEPIFVDGNPICRNWLWPKAIEVLSRGCFLIRDKQPEAENYVKNMPTVFLFEKETEALDLLNKINSLSNKEKNERIKETINYIQNELYYQVICDNLTFWWNKL